MTDYNKLKVPDLRAELKERGIASTGLTRKAQIIERLEEDDREKAGREHALAQEEVVAIVEGVEKDEEDISSDKKPAAPEEREAEETGHVAAEETGHVAPAESQQPKGAPIAEQEPPTVAAESGMRTTEAGPQTLTSPTLPETAPSTAEEGPVAKALSTPPDGVHGHSAPETQVMDFAPSISDSAAPPVRTPSPAPDERVSIERPVPNVPHTDPAPDATSTQSGVSAVPSEEAEADRRKRKRRSDSPDMPAEVIAKKARPSEDAPETPEITLQEDVVMADGRTDEVEGSAERASPKKEAGAAALGIQKSPKPPAAQEPLSQLETADEERKSRPVEEGHSKGTPPADKAHREKERRYKDIFHPPDAGLAPSVDEEMPDRPIQPALHPATPALYIRNLMRPLKAPALESHLISLATPPSNSPDPSVLIQLFLDSIKTHALVLFASTNAASRVRASLHDVVWPPEGQRKALFVDFIPPVKAEEWIREEEEHIAAEKEARAAGRPIPPKKFEIVYPTNEQGEIEAVFQEVGSSAPANAPRGPRSDLSRNQLRRESGGEVPPSTDIQAAKQDLGKSFQTLDQLFSSTSSAKPKLYYLPVSDQIADRRLDDLANETSRDYLPGDWVRGRAASGLNAKHVYSFDEDDRVIDVAADFGPWAERGSGGEIGGRGARGGGGFRSDAFGRGGGGYGGGSWRGRGRGGFRDY